MTDTDAATEECIACAYFFSPAHIATAPCGHRYCIPCLGRLINETLTDQTRFPPRCCHRTIPDTLVPAALIGRYRQVVASRWVGNNNSNNTLDEAANPELLAVARQRGWQRCYACGQIVERAQGCEHIST